MKYGIHMNTLEDYDLAMSEIISEKDGFGQRMIYNPPKEAVQRLLQDRHLSDAQAIYKYITELMQNDDYIKYIISPEECVEIKRLKPNVVAYSIYSSDQDTEDDYYKRVGAIKKWIAKPNTKLDSQLAYDERDMALGMRARPAWVITIDDKTASVKGSLHILRWYLRHSYPKINIRKEEIGYIKLGVVFTKFKRVWVPFVLPFLRKEKAQ
jgi:hypothetical protein